ncbi:hypothetical protein AgCh_012968 [Apium graveolens]
MPIMRLTSNKRVGNDQLFRRMFGVVRKDYEEAARLRDSLKSSEEEEPVLHLKRLLREAIANEKFEAGQESFRSITRSYYRGVAGTRLVYDITSWCDGANDVGMLQDSDIGVESGIEGMHVLN